MFDIGFWEIALIGVIALLVVGPERLPALARNVGKWVGRIRRYVTHVKQDIERELHADEVRQLLEGRDGLKEIRDVAEETASALKAARGELDDAARSAEGRGDDTTAPATPADSGDEPRVRSIPHHAVDEDPFAPSNLASVTPGTQPTAASGTTPEPDTDSDHEQHPDRQGQR